MMASPLALERCAAFAFLRANFDGTQAQLLLSRYVCLRQFVAVRSNATGGLLMLVFLIALEFRPQPVWLQPK